MPDKIYEQVFRAPESALYAGDTIYVVQSGRMEARGIQVQGYAGDDILFVSASQPAVVDGDQVVTTQIREGGAGVRVEVRGHE